VGGRMDDIRREWEAAISREVQDKRIPSISYALVDRQETLASGHITLGGLAHAVTDESIFRVGSCSKMFTGIALMQLVEQGRVDIDKDAAEYVPGFSPHNPFAPAASSPPEGVVTLRKLMSHTAGMVREATVGHYLDDSDVSMEEMVEELKTSTLKEDPDGCVFQYSNAGVAVVGYVVQRVSGVDFATYVRENVLDPLGMKRSSFVQTPHVREHLAPAYMWTFERDFPAPVFDMGGGGAAGNLFSTVPEMAEFVRTMLRGGFTESGQALLSPGTLHSMWEPIGRKGKAAYGLTFGLGSLDGWKSVGHNGAVYGYATQLTFLPEAGLGVVLCATLDMVNGVISRLGAYGLRLALAARGMGHRPDPQPTYRHVTAEQVRSLPGTFCDEASGETVNVVAKDSRLYLVVDDLPLRIQAKSTTDFEVDGRAFGPGSEYPHLSVAFDPPTEGGPQSLTWKGITWRRIVEPKAEAVPDEFLRYVGEYGPDFNITYVFFKGGKLKCTIEYFFTHTLEKVADGIYKMHGLLYDDETLEFNVSDGRGHQGIRVGPMFLARRAASA
jgi:CubicO group peptidase (beta-lactamase class C family)